MTNETKKLLEAKEFAILKGGLCISDKYINPQEKLEWKCHNPNHPSWLSTFKNIVFVKRWCPACGAESRSEKRKNKNGLEDAQKYALSKGGVCLSEEYIAARDKLEWKCDNLNHPSWFSSFDTVVNNKKWCPACGIECRIAKRKNKDGLVQAQQHAIKKGGICLSNEYIGARSKLEWKCSNPNHLSWFASYDTVINHDKWCFNCAQDKNFERWRTEGLKEAKQYAKTRGGECLSTEFISGNKKLEWKCSNTTHPSWFRDFHSVTSKKSWCKLCVGDSIQEFKVRNILNYLFDTDFIKTQSLSWNINSKTNSNLELDGYSDNLKIAFEFQGVHHYELVFNNTQTDLEDIQYKDELKIQNCINNNVALIIVNEIKKKNFDDFYKEILRGIEKAGLQIDENRKNNILKLKQLYNLHQVNDKQDQYLKEAQAYALTRNGKCLSNSYKNSNERLEWKCSNPNHSSWFAVFYSVVKVGSWCWQCHLERRKK